jgi:hypothetical protein
MGEHRTPLQPTAPIPHSAHSFYRLVVPRWCGGCAAVLVVLHCPSTQASFTTLDGSDINDEGGVQAPRAHWQTIAASVGKRRSGAAGMAVAGAAADGRSFGEMVECITTSLRSVGVVIKSTAAGSERWVRDDRVLLERDGGDVRVPVRGVADAQPQVTGSPSSGAVAVPASRRSPSPPRAATAAGTAAGVPVSSLVTSPIRHSGDMVAAARGVSSGVAAGGDGSRGVVSPGSTGSVGDGGSAADSGSSRAASAGQGRKRAMSAGVRVQSRIDSVRQVLYPALHLTRTYQRVSLGVMAVILCAGIRTQRNCTRCSCEWRSTARRSPGRSPSCAGTCPRLRVRRVAAGVLL